MYYEHMIPTSLQTSHVLSSIGIVYMKKLVGYTSIMFLNRSIITRRRDAKMHNDDFVLSKVLALYKPSMLLHSTCFLVCQLFQLCRQSNTFYRQLSVCTAILLNQYQFNSSLLYCYCFEIKPVYAPVLPHYNYTRV